MTSLVTYTPSTDEWAAMVAMARALAASKLIPKVNTPEQAVAIILQGRELGIGAMQALRCIYVIENKLVLSADVMAALIYARHGDDALRVIERTDEVCTIAYKRREWAEPVLHSWSIENAERAGLLGKDNWQKYPASMLFARCVSSIGHTGFQDVILGLYTDVEVQDMADEPRRQIMVTEIDGTQPAATLEQKTWYLASMKKLQYAPDQADEIAEDIGEMPFEHVPATVLRDIVLAAQGAILLRRDNRWQIVEPYVTEENGTVTVTTA